MNGRPTQAASSPGSAGLLTPEEALRPLRSLLAKSEKAGSKLSSHTWQQARLNQYCRALRSACALISQDGPLREDDLLEASATLRTLAALTGSELAKALPGSSRHSLLCSRLAALQLANTLMSEASAREGAR